MGHGWRNEVDRLVAPDGVRPIFSERDVPQLTAQPHPPLAVFLSCYSGAFDGPEDCLAETMLRADGGPIAVLAGSRVTLPYAMSILGQELMTAFFEREAIPELGQVLWRAKRATVERPRTGDEDKQLDALAKTLMPEADDLDAQRREHLHLFNLLGDPLLRMPRPESVTLEAPREVAPARALTLQRHYRFQAK
ncbi:MAG: C25 family cysteine peptidase [Pirellulales bacterium]